MAADTAFTLVPGLHTGGWIRRDVAGRLREAGAEAYPLTLSGMSGRHGRGEREGDVRGGTGADLETHIADGPRAGEGAAVRPPSEAERPAHPRPFLIDVPERPRERVGRVDLHLPDGEGPCPAVVFVHGGPVPEVPEGTRPTPRDWPTFLGYARLVADLGAVGVTMDHRLHDVTDFGRAARDVRDAVAVVRAHPRVDAGRVALWFFSAGGLLSADWLAAPPHWLRCLALTYPLLTPLPGWGVPGPRFRPAEAVRAAGRLPVVLTRVGRERAEFAATVEEFLAAALSAGVGVRVVDVPSAAHGFETSDHSDEARRSVGLAARAVLSHLGTAPAG